MWLPQDSSAPTRFTYLPAIDTQYYFFSFAVTIASILMEPNLAAATRTDRVITISTGAIGVCLLVYGTKENRKRGPERVQGFA